MTRERANNFELPIPIAKYIEAPYKLFSKNLKISENDLVLDCASGEGLFQYNIPGKIVSIDYEQTKAKNLIVYDIIHNNGKLPFIDNQFDYSFSFETIEHLPFEIHDIFVNELIRITKHKVVIGTVMADGVDYIENYEIWKASSGKNPFHIAEYNLSKFKNLLSKWNSVCLTLNLDYKLTSDYTEGFISAYGVINCKLFKD